MERLQGPNSPGLFGEHLNVEPLDEAYALDFSYLPFLNTESWKFGEPFSNPSFQDKMTFLQLLEGLEYPSISSLTEPNFQLLLRLQQQKNPWKKKNPFTEIDSRISLLELESCITNVSDSLFPVKSETKEQQCLHSSSYPEVVSSACNRQSNSPENCKESGNCGSSSVWAQNQTTTPQFPKMPPIREKRKGKRARPSKNIEEVESQRLTHIAVERNRRKQINDHLNALRSLLPTSFVQRGDQASIIGASIDFIKELEQLLQSHQAQKQRLQSEEGHSPCSSSSTPFNEFFNSPQYTSYSSQQSSNFKCNIDGEPNKLTAESKSSIADIEVSVIQAHVNLKILSPRRPGQLLKAITALEDLCFAILHLNVTSSDRSVLYSFNLKIEEGCKLGSADDIATAVHHIFSFINGS